VLPKAGLYKLNSVGSIQVARKRLVSTLATEKRKLLVSSVALKDDLYRYTKEGGATGGGDGLQPGSGCGSAR
jgi:hypothetical protein